MDLTTLIIEDEAPARESLEILLRQFCKGAELVGHAASFEEAILKINQLKPQLLLMDIELGSRNAFDLLEAFPNPDFEVVFTTGFDNYAIRALRASAVDYLLKPIKIDELNDAIARAQERILSSTKTNLESLSHNRQQIKTLMIPDGVDNHILRVEDIACMQGDGACTYFYLPEEKRIVASRNLGYYERTLVDPSDPVSSDFFRVHTSWMINHPYITKTVGRNPMDVYMSSGHEVPVSRSRKAGFLEWLKEK